MAERMEDFAVELEASFRKIEEDDIISGTVIDVNEEEVTLDLKYYAQGIIKAKDMSDAPDFSMLRDVKVGDVIEASVIKMDDGQGNIRLSRKNATQVLSWDVLKKYMEEEQTVAVKISGVTNGGAIAYLENIRGFIPASQLSLDYVEDVNPWLHKVVNVRVITVDQEKEKLVMSAKAVLREEAKEAHGRRVSMIIPGSILEGTVESIMPYGAFVNLGDGLSGLLHISQICQKRLKSPSEVLSVGQSVKVKVQNTNDGKISLSMKELEESMEADSIEEIHFESEGEATTSLGSLFANLKLDL
ncbi:S1 RNA-binding domain-containing protein [Lachnospiraceae bacterium OttesenSCG-928-D06]|nr:S1 RNA-binding domain-containing protein [Lachnospiraceae bacterium OttesenSCG-928-D06]